MGFTPATRAWKTVLESAGKSLKTWEGHRNPRSLPRPRFPGNGPSGICLSYLLSGHTPYLSPGSSHPNPLLQSKLAEQRHLPLLEQDLEYLCEGLEGRSSNPVAVLFDSLLLPDSDFGLDRVSPLEWRYEPQRAVPHLVLGRGPPGGAWHVRGRLYGEGGGRGGATTAL